MKISLDWIKEYLELDAPLSTLIDRLNMIGLLVETFEEKDGDIILDVETHANRPDTLGHLGIAREIGVAFGLPLQPKEWPLSLGEKKTSDLIDIQVRDEEFCHRYCGLVVQNVKVGPSPDWLIKKIEAIGQKSINNVVDVTNYVLFATGHPIHAFDLAKLREQKIIVRLAQKGEVIRTLEGADVQLSPDMLVIADAEVPVAIAGVIGGEESAVSEDTRDVLIESAWFEPISVRKTSKQTGIQTEASYRFERCADISYPPRAAQIAASLLCRLGGKAAEGILDVFPIPRKSRVVLLRHQQVGAILGMDVDENFIQNTLSQLGFLVKAEKKGLWQVTIPTFRVDIEREIDLIEEVARFYGYDKVPSRLPLFDVPELPPSKKMERVSRVRQVLTHYGFDEVVNYSFADPERDTFFLREDQNIAIRNPISQRASRLRTSLLGGLMENIAWNKNRGAEGVHIFEIANVYFWESEAKAVEELNLGLASTGSIGQSRRAVRNEEGSFFFLKGACEAFMSHLRYEQVSFQEKKHENFKKGQSLSLMMKGEEVGFLGVMRPEILAAYSLKETVCAAEINLSLLMSKQPQPFQYKAVIRFPSVSRDISFLVDRDVPYQSISKLIGDLKLPYLERFWLLDRFSGPTIPGDKVSLALRFIYRHPQRTLLAKEIDNLQLRMVKQLKSYFHIQLRGGGKIDKRTGKD